MFKNYVMLSCFCISAFANGQELLWEKSYGGNKADYLFDMIPTPDNGFILAGSSLSQKTGNKNSAAAGNLDYWISKLDQRGDADWEKSFGGSGSDMLKCINHTPDGGFILGGTSDSGIGDAKRENSRGGNDYWIIKLNAKGGEEWQKTYGGKGQEDIACIQPTRDGGYIVGGSSSSEASAGLATGIKTNGEKLEKSRGNMDYWIVKLDKDGAIEWQKTYGGEYADLLRSLTVTSDGGYLAGGYSNSPQSGDKDNVNFGEGGDYWVLKLDKDGKIEWQQTIGGSGDDQLVAVIQTMDKNYILGGFSASGADNSKSKSNANGTDIWVVKLDEKGIIAWQETYNFDSNDMLTSIIENKDQTLMVAGYSRNTAKGGEGINDYIAFKISSDNGEKIWEETIGSDGEDILKKAVMTSDGGYVLAGTSNPEKLPVPEGKTRKNKKGSVTLGSGKNIAIADKAQKYLDDTVKEAANKVNKMVKDKTDALTDKINKKINKNPDSRVKVGVNGPTGDLLNMANGGGGNPLDAAGGMLSGMGNKTNKPASRSKKMNFGKSDFWIVKYGQKTKNAETVQPVQAYPNPTKQFVNVAIGFEYTKGTITVFNLAGNQLQRHKITESTVVVDLGNYAEGIYLISVTTNNGDGSVKVLKN